MFLHIYLLIQTEFFIGDEYSTESNCSSVTHSRDQSPCTKSINNQEFSNPQKVNKYISSDQLIS